MHAPKQLKQQLDAEDTNLVLKLFDVYGSPITFKQAFNFFATTFMMMWRKFCGLLLVEV